MQTHSRKAVRSNVVHLATIENEYAKILCGKIQAHTTARTDLEANCPACLKAQAEHDEVTETAWTKAVIDHVCRTGYNRAGAERDLIRAAHAEALEMNEVTIELAESIGHDEVVEAALEQIQAPVAGAAGSAVVTILERVWHLIRESNPELPDVVIVTGSAFIGPPRWAHHRPGGWSAKQEETGTRLAEMFVAGETLAKGAAFTLETMLHEAGHALASARKITDTSRQGRWHNAKFRELCTELGLRWPEGKKCDSSIGYSDMLITDETKEHYAALLSELEAAIHLTITGPGFLATIGEDGDTGRGGERIPGGRHGGKAKGSEGSGSNNLKATCGCVEPRIIRASRKVLAEGGIGCKCCGEDFRLAE